MSVLSSSTELPQHHVWKEEEEEVLLDHRSSNPENTTVLKEEAEPPQVKEEEPEPLQVKEETSGDLDIFVMKEAGDMDRQRRLLDITWKPQIKLIRIVSTSLTADPLEEAKHHIRLVSDKDLLTWRVTDHTKGGGVFAKGPISEGSFILEYRGHLIKKGVSGGFGTTMNEHMFIFTHSGADFCIDASSEDGSLGRLVNYHKTPNTNMKTVEVDGVPHLCLFAVVGINEGDEITRDYGGVGVPLHSFEAMDPTRVQNGRGSPAAASQPENHIEPLEDVRRRKRRETTAGRKRRKMDYMTDDVTKVENCSSERRSDGLGPSPLKSEGLGCKAPADSFVAPQRAEALLHVDQCKQEQTGSSTADGKPKVRWTPEMEEQLAEMWEDRECLFNVSTKSYHNRSDRNKSWQEIANAMALSVEEVRGRATTLRTQYSKLLKSKPSESGEKALTTKQTWMLESLSFLRTHVIQRATDNSLPSMKNTLATEELPCSDEDDVMDLSEDSEQLTSTTLTSHTPKPPSITKKQKKIQSTDAFELEKMQILRQMSSIFQNRRPAADADTTFGVNVTSELKLITDPAVKTRVKRQIMTVLYEAQESQVSSTQPRPTSTVTSTLTPPSQTCAHSRTSSTPS